MGMKRKWEITVKKLRRNGNRRRNVKRLGKSLIKFVKENGIELINETGKAFMEESTKSI